ncbi:hypothetical protein ACPJHQ_18890 [Rossellomorea sp. H39__3]
MEIAELKILYFEDDGIIPNNPNLPVLLYRDALSGETDSPEMVFERNGWFNSWRNGIFDYHHFHSNTHEVLGVIDGEAEVLVGASSGKQSDSERVMSLSCLPVPDTSGSRRVMISRLPVPIPMEGTTIQRKEGLMTGRARDWTSFRSPFHPVIPCSGIPAR